MRQLWWLVALALLVAGCSDDDDGESEPADEQHDVDDGKHNHQDEMAGGHEELTIATSGIYPVDPGFDKATMAATSGAHVVVTFENADVNRLVTHNWVLEGVAGAATAAIESGETDETEFIAPEPGEYAYYCSIGDHRDEGMEGTLTVT